MGHVTFCGCTGV
ncbi:phosphoglycerate mutase, partial [Nannochloropsis oceanica]